MSSRLQITLEPYAQLRKWRRMTATLVWVVCLMDMELILRAVRPMPLAFTGHDIGWNAIGSPYRSSPTADAEFAHHVEREINELTLRGRPLSSPRRPGTRRLLLVGDSQVEATTLPFGDIPEVRLEKMLNARSAAPAFEVRSVAASGWGQDQQLLALQRYFERFEADYVLMWHTPRNDFWENAFPDRSTEPIEANSMHVKPTFLLKDEALQPLDFELYLDRPSIFSALHLYVLPFRVLERFGKYGRGKLFQDWEALIPGPGGHEKVLPEQCSPLIVSQNDYSRDRATYGSAPVSITTTEAVLESRSNFSPFLAPRPIAIGISGASRVP